MSKKIFVIIGVIIILGLIGGGIYWWQKVRKDQTANWQTYRNNEIGIEFKYPSEFGLPEIEKVDNTDEQQDTNSGRKIYLRFKNNDNSYNWFSLQAYSQDYKGFMDIFAFTGNDNLLSECPHPLTYNETGEVCKIIDLNGEKAIWKNIGFFDYECSAPSLRRQIYFNNKSSSIYKGLSLFFVLEDAEQKVVNLYNCVDDQAEKNTFSEAVIQSKNIMERKNLSDEDLQRLNTLDKILSTFRFIK